MKKRIEYALCFLGVRYRWGGDNPLEGFDCSGLVLEALRSEGHVSEDMTGLDLYKYLKGKNWYNLPREKIFEGEVIFFGKSLDKISHVALALNNQQMIEAGGGDATTVTNEEAIRKNAFVRIRPINNRKDLLAILGHE